MQDFEFVFLSYVIIFFYVSKSGFDFIDSFFNFLINQQMENNEINTLTHAIIGCAMEVHRTLGNGFQEKIYQRWLALEFNLLKIKYAWEQEMEIIYKGHSVGLRRVDFFIEGKVMLEIKAVEKLEEAHKAQAINYCEAYNIPDGVLINFGTKSLEFKRVYNNRLVKPTGL